VLATCKTGGVYVVGEGGLGFRQRVQAWLDRHQTEVENAVFALEPVNLLNEREVTAFLDAIDGALTESPNLFVFDTLNRCMPGGNENAQDDMSLVVAHCNLIQRETGAHVLLNHHPGYDMNPGRGSSVLPGALDTILGLNNDSGLLTLTCDKQKDAEPFDPMYVRLTKCSDSLVIERGSHEDVALWRRIYDYVGAHPHLRPESGSEISHGSERNDWAGDRWDDRERSASGVRRATIRPSPGRPNGRRDRHQKGSVTMRRRRCGNGCGNGLMPYAPFPPKPSGNLGGTGWERPRERHLANRSFPGVPP